MSQVKHIENPIGSLERFLYLLLITHIVLMTLKGGTSGACAACKYQRRRCAADCPLAPYFPAEQPKLFQNVHRLFGVRSIVKILENLEESQRPEAMKSIIFQSYVRDRFPVQGCLGVTQQLQYMIWLAEEELKVVNSQLQLYRSQQNGHNHNHNHNEMIQEIVKQDVTSQLDLGLNVNNNSFNPLPVSETQQVQMSYTYSCSDINNNGYNSPHALFPYDNHNNGCNEIKNNGVMAIQSQLVNLQMVSNQQKENDAHGYDEIHQFLEIIDDRQSFADSKEAYVSSSGESLKEQIDEIGENELRSAATCFSLTSVM